MFSSSEIIRRFYGRTNPDVFWIRLYAIGAAGLLSLAMTIMFPELISGDTLGFFIVLTLSAFVSYTLTIFIFLAFHCLIIKPSSIRHIKSYQILFPSIVIAWLLACLMLLAVGQYFDYGAVFPYFVCLLPLSFISPIPLFLYLRKYQL